MFVFAAEAAHACPSRGQLGEGAGAGAGEEEQPVLQGDRVRVLRPGRDVPRRGCVQVFTRRAGATAVTLLSRAPDATRVAEQPRGLVPQIIRAFVESGGLEQFASKRAKADAAKAEAEAAEKAAKKEARRLARAGPQGPKMQSAGSADVEAGSGWAYAGTASGVASRKNMPVIAPPAPLRTM